MGVINWGLDFEPVPQGKTHAWYWKPGQEPMAGEFTGQRGEPITIILLNGRSVRQSDSL